MERNYRILGLLSLQALYQRENDSLGLSCSRDVLRSVSSFNSCLTYLLLKYKKIDLLILESSINSSIFIFSLAKNQNYSLDTLIIK